MKSKSQNDLAIHKERTDLLDSYFQVFKCHLTWKDEEEKIISCEINKGEAIIDLNINSKFICPIEGEVELQMPEEDFRDFLFMVAHRWIEKQKHR